MAVLRVLFGACAALVLLLGWPSAAPRVAAKSPDAAPALPAPSGDVVQVSTVAALQAAVGSLASNRTIVIAPGTYQLTSTLWINGTYANVTIRGATNDPDDVVLVGRGMGVPDAAVPFGIWSGGSVTSLTIANLTIRDIYQHPILFNAGTESPRVYNVRLVNAGEQFLKANPDGSGGGVDQGIVEYSTFEYTNTAPSDYTNAVDVHRGRDWIIRHNLFRRIRAPQGQLAGPAILMWNGSSGAVVEGNTFIDCHREIALGLVPRTPDDHTGGVIRNNVIVRHAGMGGDVAIGVFDSPGTKVVHNTVLMNGQYPNAIEYRFANTTGVSIVNNLSDAGVQARDGASASLAGNVWTAAASWFVNATAGDLHLQPSATLAIDRGVGTADAPDDWDGEPRGGAGAPDVGADERVAASPPAPDPSPPSPPSPAPPSPSPPTPNPPPSPPGPSPAPDPAPNPPPGGAPPLVGPDDVAPTLSRRRSTSVTGSGRMAAPRDPEEMLAGEGVVRQLQAAVGVQRWVIQSGDRLYEIEAGGLAVPYQVDGLPVLFEARPRFRRTGLLPAARLIEIVTIALR